jgi:hypothetical protein
LRAEPARLPKLKTKPRDKDWLEMDKNGERSIYPWDLDMQPGLNAPRVPPGFYIIHLKTEDLLLEQLVEVLNDPNSPVIQVDIEKQFAFGVKLNKAIRETTDLIEEIERKRSDLEKKIKEEKSLDKQNGMKGLEERLYQIEGDLFDIKQTGARQDNFRNPVKILERMLAISKESINASGDHPPTDQQGEVYTIQRKQLDKSKADYQAVMRLVE